MRVLAISQTGRSGAPNEAFEQALQKYGNCSLLFDSGCADPVYIFQSQESNIEAHRAMSCFHLCNFRAVEQDKRGSFSGKIWLPLEPRVTLGYIPTLYRRPFQGTLRNKCARRQPPVSIFRATSWQPAITLGPLRQENEM